MVKSASSEWKMIGREVPALSHPPAIWQSLRLAARTRFMGLSLVVGQPLWEERGTRASAFRECDRGSGGRIVAADGNGMDGE
jgi:hypothetical protein